MEVPVYGVAVTVNVADGVLHLIVLDALQLTLGGLILDNKVVEPLAVHPFPDWVTTTV
jgi:hypothetical protein